MPNNLDIDLNDVMQADMMNGYVGAQNQAMMQNNG